MSETTKAKRTIEVDIELSQEAIDCIIEMAGYGIAYWAVSASDDEDARTYTIQESEEGDSEIHVLTYDQIVEAFWKIASFTRPKGVGSMVQGYALNAVIDGLRAGDGDVDAGHIDADLADSIIQLACFDKVIYG